MITRELYALLSSQLPKPRHRFPKISANFAPTLLSQAANGELQTNAQGRAAQVSNVPSLPCLEDLLKTPTHRRACLSSRSGEPLPI